MKHICARPSCQNPVVRQYWHCSTSCYNVHISDLTQSLELCPKCITGTAVISTHDPGNVAGWDYKVECQECECQTDLWYENVVGAVEEWNKRPVMRPGVLVHISTIDEVGALMCPVIGYSDEHIGTTWIVWVPRIGVTEFYVHELEIKK